ncbi:hypothetical protein SprV_0200900100 [Sparganum proliferum]
MVGPSVDIRNRLCHQYVPLVSHPDEDTVQQAPVSRPMVHTGRLFPRQKAKGVGQGEAVFCVGLQEEQAIVTGAVETLRTQQSPPGSIVCADAEVGVTKDNHLIRLRQSRWEGAQFLVEFGPYHVRTGHRGSEDAEDAGEFASPERQVEAYQAIVDALRKTGQSSHDVDSDGKGNARVQSLCLGAIAAEEGVAGTNLLLLALFG